MLPRPAVPAAAAALLAAGCAYMQSYTPSRLLERPPYYDTYSGFVAPSGNAVGHLPIGVDEAAVPDAHERTVLAPLLGAMNAYLDGAGWSVRLAAAPPPAGAPWAYVGSERGLRARSNLPADSTKGPVMVIRSLGPSRRWAARLKDIAAQQQVSLVLAISLGPGEYYARGRSVLMARKEVELGTDYRVGVGRFEDPDRPVRVLHLTGVLLTPNGKVLRAGAEGIAVEHTGALERATGLETELTDDDVAIILGSLRRDDLDGHPLAWQVALRNLVGNLLGTP